MIDYLCPHCGVVHQNETEIFYCRMFILTNEIPKNATEFRTNIFVDGQINPIVEEWIKISDNMENIIRASIFFEN